MFKKFMFILLFLFLLSSTAGAVSLQWDPNPDADYYVVYCATSAADQVAVYTTPSASVTSLDLATVVFKGGPLSPGINYSFTVKAFNACGNSSDFSDALAYLIPVPATINSLGISGTKLAWSYSDPASPATSYRITYSSTNNSGPVPSIVTKTIIVGPSVVNYDLCGSNFSENVQYTFTVSACNSSGVWGAESNSVTYIRRSVSKPSNLKIR